MSFLARYSGRTQDLYAFPLRRWFSWCESNGLDPLIGIQRAHVELHVRQLGESGLMDSSAVTMMHGVRGFFRYAHIDGSIATDPAGYARLPKVHRDESGIHVLDRLELIRFLQVSQALTVTGKPIDRRHVYRMVQRIARAAGIPRRIRPIRSGTPRSPTPLDDGVPLRDAHILARHADPLTIEHDDQARGNLDRHGVHFLTA